MNLLDTDIISNLGKRRPAPPLLAKIADTPPEQLVVSSITIGELVYGAYRQKDRTTDLLRRAELVQARMPIIPFDSAAARQYGALRAELELKGTPLAEADLRIAAIALAHELTLVTGNVRHFERVPGLRVENWLVPEPNP